MLDMLQDKRESLELLRDIEWSYRKPNTDPQWRYCPVCRSGVAVGVGMHAYGCRLKSQIERLEREIAEAEREGICAWKSCEKYSFFWGGEYCWEHLCEFRKGRGGGKEKTCAYRDPCGACNAATYRDSKFCFGHWRLGNARTCAYLSCLVDCNEKVYKGGAYCYMHRLNESLGENCCMGHPGCNCRENLPAFVTKTGSATPAASIKVRGKRMTEEDQKHVPYPTCCKEHCFPEAEREPSPMFYSYPAWWGDYDMGPGRCVMAPVQNATAQANAERIRELREDYENLSDRVKAMFRGLGKRIEELKGAQNE